MAIQGQAPHGRTFKPSALSIKPESDSENLSVLATRAKRFAALASDQLEALVKILCQRTDSIILQNLFHHAASMDTIISHLEKLHSFDANRLSRYLSSAQPKKSEIGNRELVDLILEAHQQKEMFERIAKHNSFMDLSIEDLADLKLNFKNRIFAGEFAIEIEQALRAKTNH